MYPWSTSKQIQSWNFWCCMTLAISIIWNGVLPMSTLSLLSSAFYLVASQQPSTCRFIFHWLCSSEKQPIVSHQSPLTWYQQAPPGLSQGSSSVLVTGSVCKKTLIRASYMTNTCVCVHARVFASAQAMLQPRWVQQSQRCWQCLWRDASDWKSTYLLPILSRPCSLSLPLWLALPDPELTCEFFWLRRLENNTAHGAHRQTGRKEGQRARILWNNLVN